MAKQAVAPVHVRLAPETLEALRQLAGRRGDTVHAEVVRAVEAQLARDGEEDEIRALKLVASVLLDRFAWMVPPDGEDHLETLLTLFQSAMNTALGGMGARGTHFPGVSKMGETAAKRLLGDMQNAMAKPPGHMSAEDKALAEAGRALLGVGVERKP